MNTNQKFFLFYFLAFVVGGCKGSIKALFLVIIIIVVIVFWNSTFSVPLAGTKSGSAVRTTRKVIDLTGFDVGFYTTTGCWGLTTAVTVIAVLRFETQALFFFFATARRTLFDAFSSYFTSNCSEINVSERTRKSRT